MNKRKGDQTITMDAGETKRLQCISPSKKEDSEEDAVLNKKKLIWDDNW
jgi:hypothetical protein